MTGFAMGPALLFCPADRPDRFAKAAARADAVILDLEDAVTAEAKPEARRNLARAGLDPARTIVRVNPAGTDDLLEDLHALVGTPYRTVMLAKTAGAADVHELASYDVVALVETAVGVVEAAGIAAVPNVVGLMWGAEDLVASMGGTASRDAAGAYRAVAVQARSTVLLAARAVGKVAIDAVHVEIDDVDGLAAEATDAAASGFGATACIHPSQVPVVRAAYRPSEAEVAWARGVLAAAVGQHGAFRWEGRLVDGPILKHAEHVLARASTGS
ncbi:HpcH/HpaI aldolase/citrate lyase family protein [Cellulomonas edaphi]|uniref:CoA ester lyase n=1 Tax=Cellulomonas edaphi TaxID=3053468 RepID=A0ABT7SA69_9CELL|nr:CoA ester lyase [Cellulomons edaphi]MDM7832512.1 CoA ester lyase [Cellulomons edaphi]